MQFGLASIPLEGAEGLAIFPGGDRSQGFVIATEDRRLRPSLGQGETALYSAENTAQPGEDLPEGVSEGDPLHAVLLKSGRQVEMAGETVTILLNGTPLTLTAAEGLVSITAPGIVQINDTVMPAPGGGGGSVRPAVQNLEADTVNLAADTLKYRAWWKKPLPTPAAACRPASAPTRAGTETIVEGP